jgi:hypothetical protein
MDVGFEVKRFQFRGDPGPLAPREARLNPDGTLEFGGVAGSTFLFRPATEPGAIDANQVFQGMPNFFELYIQAKL